MCILFLFVASIISTTITLFESHREESPSSLDTLRSPSGGKSVQLGYTPVSIGRKVLPAWIHSGIHREESPSSLDTLRSPSGGKSVQLGYTPVSIGRKVRPAWIHSGLHREESPSSLDTLRSPKLHVLGRGLQF